MEDQETCRKIVREWMALPKDKRRTEEQVVVFAKKDDPAYNHVHVRQSFLRLSRDHKFRTRSVSR